MDKIQQAIIYNARVNEKEHKELETKIKGVSDSVDSLEQTINNKLEKIELTPGEKGDKGDSIIGPVGPQGPKGDSIVGPKGDKGDDGKDADEEFIIERVIEQIPIPENGKDGKDGSPDTGEEIVKKINSQNDKIDYSKIKNLPAPIVEVREIHTGGGVVGLETIKNNGTIISNSTKSLNFIGATVTRDSDNVSVTINDPDLTAYLDKATYDPASGNKQVAFAEDVENNGIVLNLQNQFNTNYASCYSEVTTSDGDGRPTLITYYETSAKLTTLYTKAITYTSGLPTTVVITDLINGKKLTITNVFTGGAFTSSTSVIATV